MGLLNRLFGSIATIAHESEKDAEEIVNLWQKYKHTLPEKFEVMEKLKSNQIDKLTFLKKLEKLNDEGLDAIHKDINKEGDLIPNLRLLNHNKKIKRVNRLKDCLYQVETKNAYVLELLFHLQTILRGRKKLIMKLKVIKDTKLSNDLINSEITLEKNLVEKLDDIQTLNDILKDLSKGEKLISSLSKNEKRIIRYMETKLPEKGITDKWIRAVYDRIEEWSLEAVESGKIDQDYYMEFKFVNSKDFEILVWHTIRKLRGRMPSEATVTAFIHVYREDFNYK